MRRTAWIGALAFCAALAPPVSAQFFEHSYALVVGIDTYQSARFPKLSYAVKDAQAIAAYLQKQGYEVIPLYKEGQATKQAILQAMQNSIAPRLKANDRVLVFFAGHGYTETLGGKDRGYIVPVDGTAQSASYISMDELVNQSSYMGNARHQLFIMDSCYGGLLAGTRASLVDPSAPDYLGEITKRSARQVITAGGPRQQVLDGGPKGHSFFVDYLLEALQDGLADFNRDGYVTFDELSAYLIPRASNPIQTPATGIMPGGQGGEYLFASPATRAAGQPVAVPVPGGVRRDAAVSTPGTGTFDFPYRGNTEPAKPVVNSLATGTTRVNSKDNLPYVWINAGSFTMGCSLGDNDCESDEKPPHSVNITKGFWIGQTEATQEAYQKVMGTNPSYFKGAKLPVENIDGKEALSFCQLAGMRLPTEEEWEYAARAGDTQSRYGDLASIAWYQANSGHKTHEVGQKGANAWGLFDTLGNVTERTADWYGRGGSWSDPADDAPRVSVRWNVLKGNRFWNSGVRCVGDSL